MSLDFGIFPLVAPTISAVWVDRYVASRFRTAFCLASLDGPGCGSETLLRRAGWRASVRQSVDPRERSSGKTAVLNFPRNWCVFRGLGVSLQRGLGSNVNKQEQHAKQAAPFRRPKFNPQTKRCVQPCGFQLDASAK